jgi:hypothetical protein
MCDCSDQEGGEVAYRSAESGVEELAAGVGGDLGRQTGQQAVQRLGSVALQAEVVLELPDDPFDELSFTRGPSTNYPGPSPFGALLRGGHPSAVLL